MPTLCPTDRPDVGLDLRGRRGTRRVLLRVGLGRRMPSEKGDLDAKRKGGKKGGSERVGFTWSDPLTSVAGVSGRNGPSCGAKLRLGRSPVRLWRRVLALPVRVG